MSLAVHAQSELRAEISPVISCTDASPSGGGSAIATQFKNKSLVVPEELPAREVCACCRTDFVDLDARRRLYACPRKCGERLCSARCVRGRDSAAPGIGITGVPHLHPGEGSHKTAPRRRSCAEASGRGLSHAAQND